MMPRPPLIHFISAHLLWLEACSRVLRDFRREIEIIPMLADQGLQHKVEHALAAGNEPDLVMVSLDTPIGDLSPVRTVRAAGYTGSVMVLCSSYALPNRRELVANNVQGVVSSLQTLEELEAFLYALLDNRSEPLLQQQLRVARTQQREAFSKLLSERETSVLQLVAEGLKDKEIAEQLNISARTVSFHLGHIYAKLGVSGRTGATAVGIEKGLI